MDKYCREFFVEAGRIGGKIGGKIRTAKLSREERRASALYALHCRWHRAAKRHEAESSRGKEERGEAPK